MPLRFSTTAPQPHHLPMGRPSSFKPEYVDQARKLCKLGATDVELADFFGVSVTTIKNWQSEHDEFLSALKAGKEQADDRVERSLYHRATGYTYDSEKVFQFQGEVIRAPIREHVPPDTTAAIFWLKNRRKAEWRDRTEHVQGTPDQFARMTDEELLAVIEQGTKELGFLPAPVAVPEAKKPKRLN